jgi:hypothetical protein
MASLNGSNAGRGPGRAFAKGNPGGPGNPFARAVNQLRAKLYAVVSEADLEEVVKALLTKAKAGEVPAVKELLDRLIGKPPQAIQLSGGEEAITLADLQLAVWDVLSDHPDLKARLAGRLRELHARQRPDT